VIIDGAKINNLSNAAIEESEKETLKLNNIQIKNPIENGINIQSGVKGYLKHVTVLYDKAGEYLHQMFLNYYPKIVNLLESIFWYYFSKYRNYNQIL
jgi:hypothetical protein